jgi:hypothetical protein
MRSNDDGPPSHERGSEAVLDDVMGCLGIHSGDDIIK